MAMSAAIRKQQMGRFRPQYNAYRAQVGTVPASTGGWDKISNITNMKADRAIVLDNFIPRPNYLEIRRGWQEYATGIGSGPVETILVYNGPTGIQQFATGDDGTLYETTGGGAGVATTIVGLSNQRLQGVNFTSVAGTHYLFAGNGVDPPIQYDGATWGNTAIT